VVPGFLSATSYLKHKTKQKKPKKKKKEKKKGGELVG
jgi:hypothetical protein